MEECSVTLAAQARGRMDHFVLEDNVNDGPWAD